MNKITKQPPSLSVAIATYNEQNNIKRCLDSVKMLASEIIIVDGQSTDGTISIAKKYKNTKIISTTNKPNFHLNKQLAIDNCTSDWILQLDADESVSRELANEITKTIASTHLDGFWIKRKNFFLGRFITKGGFYPDPTLRLYRRGKARLPCQDVHEQAEVNGQVGWLTNDLLHFSDPTFSRYLLRNDRYTSLIATKLYENGVRANILNFVKYFFLRPTITFISTYFRHRGYVDGFPGFVFCFFSALRFPISFVKLWELSKT